MLTKHKERESNVISALTVRSQFGRILKRVDEEDRSYVIERRGMPKAIILSIKDYVRLAAPEPEILRVIGEESRRKRTNKLSMRKIDALINKVRKVDAAS